MAILYIVAAVVTVLAIVTYAMFDKIAEALIWKFYLTQFKIGCFALTMPDGSLHEFGDKDSKFRAELTLHSKKAFTRMVLKETIGLAEAYMEGEWDSPDLARVK